MRAGRLFAMVGLVLCSAAWAEHAADRPVFCGFRFGCDEVMHSAAGAPWGVPLPLVGMVAFGGFLFMSLTVQDSGWPWLIAAGILFGLAGLTLLTIQITWIGQICPVCTLVDVSAVGLAGSMCWARRRQLVTSAASWGCRGAWLAAIALAVVTPPAWAWLRPSPPLPEAVRQLWMPGQITVVEVTDFECEHCRAAHAVLEGHFRERHLDVKIVRLPAAMPRHAGARVAARAYLAAEAQNKGDAMAAALFATTEHTVAGCRQLAASLGLNLPDYDAVVNDAATDARIDAVNAWAPSAGPGLPLIWVQNHSFYGVPSRAWLRGAERRAQRFVDRD